MQCSFLGWRSLDWRSLGGAACVAAAWIGAVLGGTVWVEQRFSAAISTSFDVGFSRGVKPSRNYFGGIQ
jgi:hypothetical protein